MRNLDAEKPSLGEMLFELGWQQGTLFSAPSACFSLNKFSDQDPVKPIVQETRKTKPNEKFVLISQDCDIVASEAENDEPNVEAILCKPEKQKFVRRISSKSARWFVIDANSGLVAHAKYRTQFDLQLILLIKSDGLTVEEANAIDTFDQVVQASLNPNLVHLQPQRTLTEEEISLKEFYASRPI